MSESSSSSSGPLSCPRCALAHSLEERFCRECGMPLVYAGMREDKPVTSEHERARKIDPRYASGELVRVAGARNQAEAELIQGILLEEGVPSMTKRTRGFDVPDFLAAGPRDILVPESGYELARGLLTDAQLVEAPPPGEPGGGAGREVRILAGLLAGLALGVLVVWLMFQATA